MYTLDVVALSTGLAGPLRGTADQIADRIRDEIEGGAFAPGDALNQVELAQSFGLSRIPIREALRRLEAEGYVTYLPNKGAVVTNVRRDDVFEIIEIRECLELRLMDRAVERLDAEIVANARAALRSLNAARTAQALCGAHERFHTVLFEAAGRPCMTSLINAWRFRWDGRSDEDGRMRRTFAAGSADIHRRLIEACVRSDRKGVRRCVTDEYAYIRSIASSLRGS
jgi:DNA-binding GntR family transcriptional regulator